MSCVNHIKGKSTHFVWKIPRFEMILTERIASPLFSSLLLEGSRWYLEIRGRYSLVKNIEISLHRDMDDGPESTSVNFQLEFFRNNIQLYAKSFDAVVFKNNADFYDWRNTLHVIFDIGKAETFHIAIHCRVRPSQDTLNDRQIYQKVDENLSGNLRSLFLSSLYYDTILRSKDSHFKCHKAILHARIPKLLAIRDEQRSAETITRITLEYNSSKALHSLLLYAYTGLVALEGDESECNEFISIACLYGDQNLVRRLTWNDCVTATATVNCESESITWPVKRIVYLNVNLVENTTNYVKGAENSEEVCSIQCEMLPDENGKEHLYLKITFPPNVLSRLVVVLGQIQLLLNNSANAITLCNFRHYVRSDETSCYLKKTMSISYLQTIISKVIFDETFFRFKFNIQVWKGVTGHEVKNSEEPPINLFECEACHQLSSDLQILYHAQDYYDVTFISENNTAFPAHRAIVAARSSMLKDVLETNEGSDFIYVAGVTHESLSQTLLWVYNGLQNSE